MFGIAEALTLKFKLVLLGVALALLGLLWYGWKAKDIKIDTLQKTVAVEQVANNQLNNTVTKQVGTAAINEEITTETIKKTSESKQKQEAIRQKMQDRIKQIEQQPQKPASGNVVAASHSTSVVPTDAARDQQISEVIIDGLWESYCEGVPAATECKQPA